MNPSSRLVQRRLPTTINALRVKAIPQREVPNFSRTDLGFETDVSYKNGLPWPVTAILRNGIALTIPPLAGNYRTHSDFIAYVRYRFARNVNIDVQRILDDVSDSSSLELRALKQAVEESRVNLIMNGHECVLAYTVTREQFEQYGGSLYIDELDIALSTSDTALVATTHPESQLGRMLRASQEKINPGFSFRLEINDPYLQFGDRFLNIAGKVYRITASSDTTKPEGVYIRTSGNIHEVGGSGENFLTFDAAKQECLLFSTSHEAETLGNLAEAKKREIEELQHQQKLVLMEREEAHRKIKLDLEAEMLQYKQQRAEQEKDFAQIQLQLKEKETQMAYQLKEFEAKLAHEKAIRESQRDYEKDHYERRSYVRKDTSEIVKWAPAIVVGAGILLSKFL
jgi:hypothetical protein